MAVGGGARPFSSKQAKKPTLEGRGEAFEAAASAGGASSNAKCQGGV